MLASEIITEARKLAFVNSTQFPDAQMVTWLNFVYQEVCGAIKLMNENYFYVRGYIDTVPYQNVYTFTLPTSSVKGVQKILQMTVKYQADTYDAWVTGYTYEKGDKVMNNGYSYVANQNMVAGATFAGDAAKRVQIYEGYTEAREMTYGFADIDGWNAETMNAFVDRYGKMIDINSPVYTLSSTTNQMLLGVYPYIENTIKSGIKYDGIATIIDLTSTSAEADILIERNYHKVLVLGIIPYIYQARGMYNENTFSTTLYEDAKKKMLEEITDRTFSGTTVWLPNLVGLE